MVGRDVRVLTVWRKALVFPW